MGRLFNEAFNDFLAPVAGSEEVADRSWMPAVDVLESDNELRLTAELPGLTRDDVSITLENNVLTISGERKFEKESEKDNYHRIERAYGRFSRSFTLPAHVSVDDVKADFRDGVLQVTLPKAAEARPRRIEIA